SRARGARGQPAQTKEVGRGRGRAAREPGDLPEEAARWLAQVQHPVVSRRHAHGSGKIRRRRTTARPELRGPEAARGHWLLAGKEKPLHGAPEVAGAAL